MKYIVDEAKSLFFIAEQDFIDEFDSILTFLKLSGYSYNFKYDLRMQTNLCSEIIQSTELADSKPDDNIKLIFTIYNSTFTDRIKTTLYLNSKKQLQYMKLKFSEKSKNSIIRKYCYISEYTEKLKQCFASFERASKVKI